MGYSTEFKGQLSFVTEPKASQLAALKSMFGEDCRDHPEWGATDLYYVDLELTEDFTGIQWDGSEKTYALEKLVNVILVEMRKKWPEFGLTGTLTAQGEDIFDRWDLTIEDDGLAHKVKVEPTGKIITCPHCEQQFELEE
jgi:hypothetical protein